MSIVNSIIPVPAIGSRSGLLLPCSDTLLFESDKYNDDYTEMSDQSEEGNDAVVTDVQVATLNGSDESVLSQNTILFTNGFNMVLEFFSGATPSLDDLCGTRTLADPEGEFWIRRLASSYTFYYKDSAGLQSLVINDTYVNNIWRTLTVSYENDIITFGLQDENGTDKTTSSGVVSMTPSPFKVVVGKGYTDFDGAFSNIRVNKFTIENQLEWYFKESIGTVAYDRIGSNSGDITTLNEANIWANKTDDLGSVLLQNNYGLYSRDSDGEKLRRLSTTEPGSITGYTFLSYIISSNKIFSDTGEKITFPTYGAQTLQELKAQADVGTKIFFRNISDYEIDRIRIHSEDVVNSTPQKTLLAFDYGLANPGDPTDGKLFYFDENIDILQTIDVEQVIIDAGFQDYYSATYLGRDIAYFKDGTDRLVIPFADLALIFEYNKTGLIYTGQYVRAAQSGVEGCEMLFEDGKNILYFSTRDTSEIYTYEVTDSDQGNPEPTLSLGINVGIAIDTISIGDAATAFGFKLVSNGNWYVVEGGTGDYFIFDSDWNELETANIGINDGATQIGNYYGLCELPSGYVIPVITGGRISDGVGGYEDMTEAITMDSGGILLPDITSNYFVYFDLEMNYIAHLPIPIGGTGGAGMAVTGVEYLEIGEETTCYNQEVKYVGWLQYARKDSDGSYRLDSNGEYIIDTI
jgi:hypothetical protein